ncbi:MAG: hypothetical protein IJ529_01645, partial [Alphaproteobacteria bacterium]|nr:hypothetical protein [Alphaproteobacteria bacterium]
LADVNADKYDACFDERDSKFGQIELKIPERWGEDEASSAGAGWIDGNHFFNRDFSDIYLNLVDDPTDKSTDYYIEDGQNITWKNVKFALTGQPYGLKCYVCYAARNSNGTTANKRVQSLCDGNYAKEPTITGSNGGDKYLTYYKPDGSTAMVLFYPSGSFTDDVCGSYVGKTTRSQATIGSVDDYDEVKVKYADYRHLLIMQNAILNITGKFATDADWIFAGTSKSGRSTSMPRFHFYIDTASTIIFKDMPGYNQVYGVDFDGAKEGQMLFYNVNYLYMPRVWSWWKIGFENSTVNFDELKIRADKSNTADIHYSIGGTTFSNTGSQMCHGIYLKNSKVEVTDDIVLLRDNYGKIYIDKDSEFRADKGLVLVHKDASVACVKGNLYSGSKRYFSDILCADGDSWGCVNGSLQDEYGKYGQVCHKEARELSSATDYWGSRYKNSSTKKWGCSTSYKTTDNYGKEDGENAKLCSTCNVCEFYGMGIRREKK